VTADDNPIMTILRMVVIAKMWLFWSLASAAIAAYLFAGNTDGRILGVILLVIAVAVARPDRFVRRVLGNR
jgi:hypothetical protein